MSIDRVSHQAPSAIPNFFHKEGLVNMWSMPYSRQELEKTFPVATPSSEILHRSMADVIRQSVTRDGEFPYQNADISLHQFSPETVAELIKPVSTYLSSNRLESLYYEDISLRSLGIDMFNLNDVAIYKGQQGEAKYIGPPVVERNSDGTFSVVDGHHRLYLSMLFGIPINVEIVDNFDQKHRNPYSPLAWEDITPAPVVPAEQQKHFLIPGLNENDVVEMSLAGDPGSRKVGLPKEAPFFHENPIKKSKKLGKWANDLLKKMGVEPLFPVVFSDQEPLTKVTEVENTAIPLDGKHFMPTIHVDNLQGRFQGIEHVYRPIAEKKGAFKNRARLITIDDGENSSEICGKNTPANETHIPTSIRESINELLKDRNLVQIIPRDSLGHRGDVPETTSFQLIEDNPYFSVLVLHQGDEGSLAYKINHRNNDNVPVDGSVYLVRDQNNDLILIDHWRPLFGMWFLEAPRQFGYDPLEFGHEVGVDINIENLDSQKSEISGNREVDIEKIQIISSKWNSSSEVPPNPNQDIHTEKMSDLECHQLIAKGKINCEFTAAAITIDQLKSGKLKVNPDINPNHTKIYLEKFYSPLEDKYYFRPTRVKSGTGTRFGENSFTDTGSCLEYNHTEIGDNKSLPEGRFYQSFSPNDVVGLMLSDQLDSTAIAHLSRVLRSRDILVMNQ